MKKLQVIDFKIKTDWVDVLNAARTTVGKEAFNKEPTSTWKKKILRAEHSPIRKFILTWKWIDLPYWVSVHFVRHKVGIEHFVSTQRSDRTGIKRDELPQGALVSHEIMTNAQSMINISRKRLCKLASKETQEAWNAVIDELKKTEPELAESCVPECIYRGGYCPEMKSCGFCKTTEGQALKEKYWNE